MSKKYFMVDIPEKWFQMYRVSEDDADTIEEALKLILDGRGEIAPNELRYSQRLEPDEYPWYHVTDDGHGIAFKLDDGDQWNGMQVY